MAKDSTKKLKRVVIKEELVELTGHYIKALILNQFVYWSERTKDFDAFIEEERRRDPEINMPLSHGWIYKTASDLSDELMLDLSDATIRKYVQDLIGQGYLDERTNPKHKWDRTLQYRVNIRKLQEDLHALGYALERYPLLVDNVGVSENKNQSRQKSRAIPEITIETTMANADYTEKTLCNGKNGNGRKTNASQQELFEELSLEPDTPGGHTLFAKVNRDRKAKRRRKLRKFPTIQCKEKFLKAERYLGEEVLEQAIDKTLEQGITAIGKMVSYIAGWKLEPTYANTDEPWHFAPCNPHPNRNRNRKR